jgi:uncharacterized membrane protein
MNLLAFKLIYNLFLLTVGTLVVFGADSLLRVRENSDRAILYIFYTVLMFSDAAVMLFCALQLNERTKLIFFLSIFVLAFNILPTIFDQFGLADLLFLLLNLITLVFLLIARKEFLPA